jgi:hypothetical protein
MALTMRAELTETRGRFPQKQQDVTPLLSDSSGLPVKLIEHNLGIEVELMDQELIRCMRGQTVRR